MEIRLANEADYNELALMKWEHGAEDDIDYDEHNLDGVNKDEFVDDFVAFLKSHKEYEIIVAEVNGIGRHKKHFIEFALERINEE